MRLLQLPTKVLKPSTPAPEDDSRRLSLTISPTMHRLLGDLVKTGLFGGNRAAAAERLMARGIEEMIRNGTLTSVPLPSEGDGR